MVVYGADPAFPRWLWFASYFTHLRGQSVLSDITVNHYIGWVHPHEIATLQVECAKISAVSYAPTQHY